MLDQPIAVLGGGSTGHIAAADLSLSGHKVIFYEHPRFVDTFRTTLETGMIEIYDEETSRRERAKIHNATVKIEDALRGLRMILLFVPAYGHDLFFKTMIPHLEDGQVIFVIAGNSGALRLRKLLQEQAPHRKVTVYETNTVPAGGRLTGPARVSVRAGFGTWIGIERKYRPPHPLVISALPARDTDVAIGDFQELYPFFTPVNNALVVALNTPHHMLHAPVLLLNVGPIESSKGDFVILRDGQTPSVQRVEWAVCDETAALVRALGGNVTLNKTIPQAMAKSATEHPVTFTSSSTRFGSEWRHNRHITEDVPFGLVPMAELGKKLGVATPLMNAFIDIASVINEEDYRKTGRTLESLGLAVMNKEEIIEYVEKGSLRTG